MVAGAIRRLRWKYKKPKGKASSESIISWIKQKKEFFRSAMEVALGLNTGQAEWLIKELRQKGLIKRTNKFQYKFGKGNRQVIYKYIE